MNVPEIIHHGHRIMLTDGLMFLVTGPQFEDEKYDHARTFDSASQAKKAVDSRVAAARKQAAITHRISITLLDEMGKPITVRGVNRTDSGSLGYSSPDARWDSLLSLPEMFPSVPWIEKALAARVDLLKRAAALTSQVYKYGIKARRGYGRVDADKYERLHNNLIAEIEKKTAEANAAAPATDTAYVCAR